ncbi:MAG: ABC-F family ATP-binding cassette domain-containing protein [Chlamydiales bacterium]|nr:ABC-F family ATP-binding cassette domain-containing protein [Chlamydiia bacterium]MCP5503761.1 ABC-F family ATP-binding cassette domain-containing protein [Chlamydiales bacterium]
MITLDKISKKIGTRVLFDDVSASFNPGNRYGLTGPNGAGKSTLLKIMMGVEDATSGSVSLPKKVGFLRQNIEEFKDARVLDAVIMGNERLWNALVERDMLYEKEMTDEIGMRLGDLEEIVADEEGYSAESDAEVLLIGMGIEADFHGKKMHELPSDLQFRVLLCQALFGGPEALLLDEPTNHLDLGSIGWLEEFLHNYSGTLIVVSHDRHFLNSVTTHIADIDYDTIITYPGNYDDMLVAKTAVRERAEQDAKSKEKKISQLKEFVAKFGAGTRASQVQSRIREIKRLQPQELKKSNIQRPYIRFTPPEKPSGKVVFKVEGISKAFDGNQVINNFSIEVMKGDKIAVIGTNGIGKTTLLRMLVGELEPDSGTIERGHQVDLGYFPQNHEDFIDKSEKIEAFDWLKRYKANAYDQEIRGVMGKMLFGGDDAFKEISKLSGGETARLIFAALLLNNHNTLVLDEPNNHLDLEAVSALGWGLSEFQGTAIVAAHDRDLINDFATKIISIEKDGIHVFDGTLEAYLSAKT